MGITIHYYTDAGTPLDAARAAEQYEKAVALTRIVGRRLGWKFVGRFRKERQYTEYGRNGQSREGTGVVRSALWDPDPGSETFSLEWVEGTGILPYCFVKTQFAHDRVRVHAAIVTLLDRLNRLVFDRRLVIVDEGRYLETRSADELAAGFSKNEAMIRAIVESARAKGWTVASPLDARSSDDAANAA